MTPLHAKALQQHLFSPLPLQVPDIPVPRIFERAAAEDGDILAVPGVEIAERRGEDPEEDEADGDVGFGSTCMRVCGWSEVAIAKV